jgi:uncharacterized protein YndB with AHSA1/START domain
MARAQHSVEIARPIGDVFDFLANGTNNPRWQSRVTMTTQVGDTLGVGTAFRQSMRHPLGFSVPADYRITAFERPRLLVTKVTSGARPLFAWEASWLDNARDVLQGVSAAG